MVDADPSDRDSLKPSDWTALSDDKLLEIRMCDLGLRIEGTELEARIATVSDELQTRGLSFRPHYWLSDEWFTPDGVPGIAIPFYLAHPRLQKLELAEMLEVEGGDETSCLRILRHEIGHAVDNAYRIQRRPTRRRLFGNPATPYPEYYTPKPYSKSFVQHSITGTRKVIPTRTSPRPSPSGSIRNRSGRHGSRAGRRSGSSNTWIA